MDEKEYRLLEIKLINRLSELTRNLKKVNLSQLEKESLNLLNTEMLLNTYWDETNLIEENKVNK